MSDTKDDDHQFVKAHVWPSMRNDYPQNVTVVLSVRNGTVIHTSRYRLSGAPQGLYRGKYGAILQLK